MKNLFCALALVVSIAAVRGAEPLAPLEKLGSFQFQPSAQFASKREMPGFKAPFFFATPKDGFAPNLNFIEEPSDGDWNAYLAASMEMMKKLKIEILEAPAPFELPSKLPCQRFVYRHTTAGKDIRAICFLIQLQPQQALATTFSALYADGDKWDAAVAKSLRTIAAAKE